MTACCQRTHCRQTAWTARDSSTLQGQQWACCSGACSGWRRPTNSKNIPARPCSLRSALAASVLRRRGLLVAAGARQQPWRLAALLRSADASTKSKRQSSMNTAPPFLRGAPCSADHTRAARVARVLLTLRQQHCVPAKPPGTASSSRTRAACMRSACMAATSCVWQAEPAQPGL